MKANQSMLDPPNENNAVLAATLGKIYTIVLKQNGRTPAQTIIDKAKLQPLMLHLLAAPEEVLLSC